MGNNFENFLKCHPERSATGACDWSASRSRGPQQPRFWIAGGGKDPENGRIRSILSFRGAKRFQPALTTSEARRNGRGIPTLSKRIGCHLGEQSSRAGGPDIRDGGNPTLDCWIGMNL